MSNWYWKAFADLSLDELYALMRLRQDVFVVEQNCPFQDADGWDQSATHLMAWEQGELVACLRVHQPGVKREQAVISRVVSAQSVRRRGFGLELLSRAVAQVQTLPEQTVVWLGAQQRLEKFYARFGFQVCSEPYLEDDIWHVEMQAPVGDLQVLGNFE